MRDPTLRSGHGIIATAEESTRLKPKRHPDATTASWRRHLAAAARVARRVETTYAGIDLGKPIAVVTYVTLVYQRRLAEAVYRLTPGCELEAAMLVRSMIEAATNLEWMRLKHPNRRAKRFLSYQPVARMALLRKLPAADRPDYHAEWTKIWQRRCDSVRHLFKHSRSGKAPAWDPTWAFDGTKLRQTVLQRMYDVAKCEAATQQDNGAPGATFVDERERSRRYFLYADWSRYVHAEVDGIDAVVEPSRHGLRPAEQPFHEPLSPVMFAAACLIETLTSAAQLFASAYETEIRGLKKANEHRLEMRAARRPVS